MGHCAWSTLLLKGESSPSGDEIIPVLCEGGGGITNEEGISDSGEKL